MYALTIKEIRKIAKDFFYNDLDHTFGRDEEQWLELFKNVMILASSATVQKNRGLECDICYKRKLKQQEAAKKTNAGYTTEKRKEAWLKRKSNKK